ncbi:MAG: hypothetical protein WC869_00745 [Phycisphaerae bacterium]|jgi:hypothetical protein
MSSSAHCLLHGKYTTLGLATKRHASSRPSTKAAKPKLPVDPDSRPSVLARLAIRARRRALVDSSKNLERMETERLGVRQRISDLAYQITLLNNANYQATGPRGCPVAEMTFDQSTAYAQRAARSEQMTTERNALRSSLRTLTSQIAREKGMLRRLQAKAS